MSELMKRGPPEMSYPSYVGPDDELAMEVMCAAELLTWRLSVAHNEESRLGLEQSEDELKAAWAKANEVMEVEPAA